MAGDEGERVEHRVQYTAVRAEVRGVGEQLVRRVVGQRLVGRVIAVVDFDDVACAADFFGVFFIQGVRIGRRFVGPERQLVSLRGFVSVDLNFADVAEYVDGEFDAHIARRRRRGQRIAEGACPVGRAEDRVVPRGLRNRHILLAVLRNGHRDAAGDIDAARRRRVEGCLVACHRADGAEVDRHRPRQRAEGFVIVVLRAVGQLPAVDVKRFAALRVQRIGMRGVDALFDGIALAARQIHRRFGRRRGKRSGERRAAEQGE